MTSHAHRVLRYVSGVSMCLVALLLVSGCQSVATGEVEHDVSTTYDGNGVLDGAKVRLAIATAYSPEFAALIPSLENAREYRLNGVSYWTGRMRGQDVVLFETGVSLVNAAMNTERLLQNFDVSAIVVSGVAGGVDPELSIGDVTVPRRWAQYNETVYMRQAADGSYTSPVPTELPALDYIVPRGVRIARNEDATAIRRIWFEASPELLELADQAADRARLKRCDAEGLCLPEDPEVIIGGSGVSGSIFLDNARYREYLYETFEAQVAEMETAAIAMVAFSNDIPFVAFRSLSDLAGGGKAEANEIQAFQHLAAENSAELVFAFLDVYGEVTGRADVSPPPPSFCEINFSAASVYGQGALGDDLVEWLKSRFREDSDHRDYLMSRVPQALEIAALVDPDIDAQVLQVWGGYKGRTSPSLAMRFPITAPENRETALRIAAALGYTFTQESVIAQCDDFPGDDKLTASIDLIETGAGDVLSVETLKPVFGMMLGQADGNFNLGFTYYPAEDRFSTLGFTDDGDFERSAIRSVRDDLQVFSGDSAGLTVSETPKWVAYPFNNWREQPLGEAYLEQPGIADLKPGLDAIRSDIITELQAEFSAMQQE